MFIYGYVNNDWYFILFKNKVKYKKRGSGMEGDGGMGMGYLIHIIKKHNNPIWIIIIITVYCVYIYGIGYVNND